MKLRPVQESPGFIRGEDVNRPQTVGDLFVVCDPRSTREMPWSGASEHGPARVGDAGVDPVHGSQRDSIGTEVVSL